MNQIKLSLGLMLLTGAGSALAQEAANTVKSGSVVSKSAPTSHAGKAGIRWVKIPGGKFSMGGATGGGDAEPHHEVTIKSFQMAKTLVTNKQYKACVTDGACTAAHVSDGTCLVYNKSNWVKGNLPDSTQGDDQPAVCVDWDQAKKFSEWAGGRLPTESEWEYAARSGGKNQKYPWGNEDATCARAIVEGCGDATVPVCSKPAGNTQQGLCDMAGNAWEWVEDWYHDSYKGAPTDGSAWDDTGSIRVLRGGSFFLGAGSAESADRFSYSPDALRSNLGFRPAR